MRDTRSRHRRAHRFGWGTGGHGAQQPSGRTDNAPSGRTGSASHRLGQSRLFRSLGTRCGRPYGVDRSDRSGRTCHPGNRARLDCAVSLRVRGLRTPGRVGARKHQKQAPAATIPGDAPISDPRLRAGFLASRSWTRGRVQPRRQILGTPGDTLCPRVRIGGTHGGIALGGAIGHT